MYNKRRFGQKTGRINNFQHSNKRKTAVFRDVSKFINRAKPNEISTYVAKHAFEDFALDHRIKKNVFNRGYKEPSLS